MNPFSTIDRLPVSGILFVTLIFICIGFELGFRIGSRQHTIAVEREKPYTGAIVAASLGLLAFMLAFSFNSVTSQYHQRKHLIVEEANIIGTAFLRADLLSGRERDELRKLLFDYVAQRIYASEFRGSEKILEFADEAEKMQKEMWAIAVAIANENPNPNNSLVLQSLNELIDMHQTRVTVTFHHRMPIVFWYVLYGLSFIGMILAAYDAGLASKQRSYTGFVTLVVSISVVLTLVVELDRPRQQLSDITQAALIELHRDLEMEMLE